MILKNTRKKTIHNLKMFYVCYIVKARKYAVFPANWLKDHKNQLKKFINSGLNSNQSLLAYYSQTQSEEIESGRSVLECPPDFELNTNVDFPADGCYMVIPKKCFGKSERKYCPVNCHFFSIRN